MDTAKTETELTLSPLGERSGLEVTDVGLGLWAVAGSEWGPAEDQGSLEAIETALDQGVNFFDTADVYGDGHSEELLGQAMEGRRDRFVAATKIGWINFDRESFRSQYDTVDKIVKGVEGSLRRLGTDHVDVIQCHINEPEPNTPVFIDGFRRLKEEGKVRAWGVSTSHMGLLKMFNADGDCDVLQTDYSILNRTAERELLPYCRDKRNRGDRAGPAGHGAAGREVLRLRHLPRGRFPPGLDRGSRSAPSVPGRPGGGRETPAPGAR